MALRIEPASLTTMTVKTFGQFVVRSADAPLFLDGRAARRLLLALVVAPNMRLRRDRAAADLWPDSLEAAARTNVRGALHGLRAALERLGENETLDIDVGTIALSPARWSVDLVTFEAAARSALSERSWQHAFEAALVADGAFLPDDAFEPWLENTRTRVETLRERVLAHATELALADGDEGRVTNTERLVRAAFDADALSDALAVACSRLYQRLGRRADAQRVLDRHREALGENVTHAAFAWLRAPQRSARRSDPIAPPSVSRRTQATPFVGRRAESARLDLAIDRVTEGEGNVTVVLGEPGIGKTRLCSEALERARERGALVLAASYIDTAAASLADPIARAFDRALAALGDADHFDLAAPVYASFGPILPTLERRFGTDAHPAMPPHDDRVRREAVVALARACAQRWPVVVHIDDVHLAAQSEIATVLALADAAATAPIAILATAREAEFPESPAAALFDLSAHHVEAMRVDRLPTADAIALATTIANDDDLEPALVAEHARGNALAIVESVRDGGRTRGTLAATIAARLATLAGERLTLVRAIALVEAQPLTLGDLAAVTGIDVETTIDFVEDLVSRGFAAEFDGGIGVAHPLIRDAVLADMPATARLEVHFRLGELAATRGKALAAASQFTRAGEAHREAAIAWTTRAIADIKQLPSQTFYAVSGIFQRAFDLTPDDDRRRYDIAIALGRALITSDADGSGEAFRAALRLARTPQERAVAYERLAMLYVAHQRHAEAEDACDRAEALGPDLETRAAIGTHRTWLAAFAGRTDEARRLARRNVGPEVPPRIAVGTHIAHGCACVFAGLGDEALVAFDAARVAAASTGDWQNIFVLEINSAAVHYQAGRTRMALEIARNVDDTIVIHGRVATSSVNARNVAECALALDDLALAERYAAIASRRAMRTRSDVLAAEANLVGAQVSAACGRLAEARAALAPIADTFRHAARTGLELETCSFALEYAAACDDRAAAAAWLDRGRALRAEGGSRDQRTLFDAWSSVAHALAGDADAAIAAEASAVAAIDEIGSLLRRIDVALVVATARGGRGDCIGARELLARARAFAASCDPGRPHRRIAEVAALIETPR